MLLPNENVYTVRMEPKSGSDLKSPQILNVLRAFPAGIGVLTFSLITFSLHVKLERLKDFGIGTIMQ